MATNAELIAQVYVGFYDRAPDPVGLQYWTGRLEAGVSIQDIGDSFAASPEASDTYPFFRFPDLLSQNDFLAQVYQNVFGRAIDQDGLDYYSARMTAGESAGSVVASILGNASTNEGSPDQAYLQNKVDAGLHWALEAAASDVNIYQENGRLTDQASDSSHGILDGITADPATVDEANAETDGFFGGGGVGDTFTLTSGNDFADVAGATRFNGNLPSDFKFTDASETVEAANGTLTAGDVLLDGSTADSDMLNFSNTGNLNTLNATVGNIENINGTLTNGTGNWQLTNYTGVQAITLTGSIAAGAAISVNAFANSGVSTIDTSALTIAAAGGGVNINGANADQDIVVTTGVSADFVNLGDGDNTISTGAGNDTVVVGDGSNTIDLGEGVNNAFVGTAVGEGGDSVNTITGNAGIDTVVIFNDSANTISTLGNADVITVVGGGNNTIDAGDGANSITIAAGADGDNVITGGANVDTIIVAGAGNNTIDAGAGADTVDLTGATGDNSIIIHAGDTGVTAATADIVSAFVSGSDTFDFNLAAGSATNYVEFNNGAATTVDLAVAAATAAFDGTVQYVFVDDGTNGFLVVDSNLDGAADMAVSVVGVTGAGFAFGDIVA